MNIILGLLASCALSIWEGLAIKTLWAWFVAQQFGLPPIGLAHAIGLALLISLVTHQAPSDIWDDERPGRVLAWEFVSPAVALAVGWIVRQFL
jgi:hypothetical protein